MTNYELWEIDFFPFFLTGVTHSILSFGGPQLEIVMNLLSLAPTVQFRGIATRLTFSLTFAIQNCEVEGSIIFLNYGVQCVQEFH